MTTPDTLTDAELLAETRRIVSTPHCRAHARELNMPPWLLAQWLALSEPRRAPVSRWSRIVASCADPIAAKET